MRALEDLVRKARDARGLWPTRVTISPDYARGWTGPSYLLGIPLEIDPGQTTAVTAHLPVHAAQLVIHNPLRFITYGQRKLYLTAQAFYESNGHHARTQLKNTASQVLMAAGVHMLPEIPTPMQTLIIVQDTEVPDLDNVGYFWAKAIHDALVKFKKIPEDNVNHVPDIRFTFVHGIRQVTALFFPTN